MTDVQQPPNSDEPESAASRASRTRLEVLRTVGQLGSLGMSFALAVVIGAALGAWLDSLTGWRPVLFILFFFLGLAAGILNVVRILKVTK
jgi:F0F1-type ATP synthase assembly protein I